MTPAVQQFSFLNRWFIFRRRGEAGPAATAENAEATVAVGNAKPPVGAVTSEEVAAEVQATAAAAEAIQKAADIRFSGLRSDTELPDLSFQAFESQFMKELARIGMTTS
jgi:hypothetical protein